MDYKNYTVNDFLDDPEFIQWVLQPDSEIELFWEKWLIMHPEKLGDVQEARKIILAFQGTKYHWENKRKRNLWEKIESINEREDKAKAENAKMLKIDNNLRSIGPDKTVSSRKYIKSIFRWAAVLFIIFLTSVYFINQKINEPQTISENVLLINKSIPKGQKLKIFLPDGSTVYMNSESSVSYAKNLSSNTREINLTGEAFFEVAKDSLRPFVVISDNLVITALGTSFNVKAPVDDQQISVALLTGKVSVQKKDVHDELLFLNPNEAAFLNRRDGELQRKEFNYEEDILWTKGTLYFKQIPLTEAFERLKKWYGVSFEVENLPKKTLLVTGKFDNESLDNVLQSLSHTASFEYTIDNGKIMVSF